MERSSLDLALDLAHLRRRLPAPVARRHLREGAGISQEVLAQELKVTREAIALWEAGSRTPGPRNLAAYVAVLDRLAREGRP